MSESGIIGEGASDRLSRIASTVRQEARGLAEGLKNVDFFGAPSECGGLVVRAAAEPSRSVRSCATASAMSA